MIQGWTENQLAYREEYAHWAKEHLNEGYEIRYQEGVFPMAVWQALACTSFWKIPTPVYYGGLGGNWWDFTAALEGLMVAGMDIGFILSCIAQAGTLRGLLTTGTDEQINQWLPPMLNGAISATAIAEPSSGMDVPGVQTTYQTQGNELLLSGSKWHIAHAPTAQFALVVCKGESDAGITCLWVDLDQISVGLHRGVVNHMAGLRTLPTGNLSFTNVSISSKCIFGSEGKGLPALGSAVGLARPYYGLLAAWIIEAQLPPLLSHLNARSSFGSSILKSQAVQSKLTEALMAAQQAKWTAYGAIHHLLTDAKDAIMLGSVAKLSGTQHLYEVLGKLSSLWSSHGYGQDHPICRICTDALGLISVGGTDETHLMNIANQMQRLHIPRK